MTPSEVKIYMFQNGLTVSLMAKALADESVTESSLRVMISEMVNGHEFYPRHAKAIRDKFGLDLTRQPKRKTQGVVRQAA